MNGMKFARSWQRTLAAASVVLLLVPGAFSATEKILHTFGAAPDGNQSYAGLIFDSAGNLYGTTFIGGNGFGTVFELSPAANGKWTEKILHTFTGGLDGSEPAAALIFDAAGNLYGTTEEGGASGQGTAFELVKGANGKWTKKILHSFAYGTPVGDIPRGALVFDAAGNLYGTSSSGGNFGYGAAFKIAPAAGGKWTTAAIHEFNANGHDGTEPAAGLITDTAGNLYGTTSAGGAFTYGVVFKLSKNVSGGWTETLLHTFNPANGHDGAQPLGSLVMDAAGNLYGTTNEGGANRFYGVVYKLTLGTNGKYTESFLHTFTDGGDGGEPQGNLILDAAGNIYGTAHTGGTSGVAFKLTLGTTGKWTESIIHNFRGGTDGSHPLSGLIWDAAGNLYGTTQVGGASNQGTVFEITP